MKKNKNITFIDCMIVVAILFVVATIAAQDFWRTVQGSEENTVHAAVTEYAAVRGMYTAPSQDAGVDVAVLNAR